jgi:hypothetical protein
MEATRLKDNLQVTLKKVLPEERSHELRTNWLFSSQDIAKLPDNHCAPLVTVIELQGPDSEPQKLMVFYLLCPFNHSEIQTFGEFVSFFAQICEACQALPPSYLIIVITNLSPDDRDLNVCMN